MTRFGDLLSREERERETFECRDEKKAFLEETINFLNFSSLFFPISCHTRRMY